MVWNCIGKVKDPQLTKSPKQESRMECHLVYVAWWWRGKEETQINIHTLPLYLGFQGYLLLEQEGELITIK